MALDTVTGNLLIGWYDGRKYRNRTGLNYFGAVVDYCMLDDLICQIPHSNPTFVEPAFVPPVTEKKKEEVSTSVNRHIKGRLDLLKAVRANENTTTASSTTK
jgi:hypothetical protein